MIGWCGEWALKLEFGRSVLRGGRYLGIGLVKGELERGWALELELEKGVWGGGTLSGELVVGGL